MLIKFYLKREIILFVLLFNTFLTAYSQSADQKTKNLNTISSNSKELPDLSTVKTVFKVPPLSFSKPKAGTRVKQTTPGWEGTKVYHTLYLPKDWKVGKKYPVIVEFAGNGPY